MEIDALWTEADAIVECDRNVVRRAKLAQETAVALEVALEKLTAERAFENGVTPDDLSIDDVFVTDDDRALLRQLWRASDVAGARRVAADDRRRVVARLAIERGWSVANAARAILRDPSAKPDVVRDSPERALARRVQKAVHAAARAAIAEQLRRIDQSIAAIDGVGSPVCALGLIFALVGELSELPKLREILAAERERLSRKLS